MNKDYEYSIINNMINNDIFSKNDLKCCANCMRYSFGHSMVIDGLLSSCLSKDYKSMKPVDPTHICDEWEWDCVNAKDRKHNTEIDEGDDYEL